MKRMVPFLIFITVTGAQTTVNPDFSAIGDLQLRREGNRYELESSGLELALQGYVNPFARADVFLHKHNDSSPIDLEEAVLSIERGLPLGLGARAGKLRPDLGKINRQHEHTFYFIELPEAMAKILGPEQWAATGLELNLLLPLPWYSRFSVGYFQEALGSAADDHVHHQEETLGEPPAKAFSGRWSHFLDFNPVTHLEAGFSFYRDRAVDFRQMVVGDVKFKWKPNKYRSFIFQAEWFHTNLPHHHVHIQSHPEEQVQAGYTFVNYQCNRAWNVGFVVDYYSSNLEGTDPSAPALFFGFSPVEESSVWRLKIGPVDSRKPSGQWSVQSQIIWALGPHKPHQF
ncbi:MAG: hypothetical protein ACE5D2_07690 [Fidelibacterota bacterium]